MSATTKEPSTLLLTPLPQEYAGPADAAKAFGMSKRSLYRHIADGDVIARKVGARTLVNLASLRSFIESAPIKTGVEAPLACSPQVRP